MNPKTDGNVTCAEMSGDVHRAGNKVLCFVRSRLMPRSCTPAPAHLSPVTSTYSPVKNDFSHLSHKKKNDSIREKQVVLFDLDVVVAQGRSAVFRLDKQVMLFLFFGMEQMFSRTVNSIQGYHSNHAYINRVWKQRFSSLYLAKKH